MASTSRFDAALIAPDGTAIARIGCTPAGSRSLFTRWAGNGTYSIDVTEYAENACTAPTGAVRVQYAIAAGMTLQAPGRPWLIRAPRSFSQRPLPLRATLNADAGVAEIRYRLRGRLGADGGLRGTTRQAFYDRERGTASLRFPVPGIYTVVARVTSGGVSTPWSAPVRVRAMAPFDIASVTFPDSRGPSYLLRARMRDRSAAGARVGISVAPGARGGKFRSLGVARISRAGNFVKRFRLSGPGVYRLRYTFPGTRDVVRGRVTQRITIRRTLL